MQFTLVVTSTKSRKNRSGGFKETDPTEIEKCVSCRLFWATELWVKFYSFYEILNQLNCLFFRLFQVQFFYKMVHFFVFVLV